MTPKCLNIQCANEISMAGSGRREPRSLLLFAARRAAAAGGGDGGGGESRRGNKNFEISLWSTDLCTVPASDRICSFLLYTVQGEELGRTGKRRIRFRYFAIPTSTPWSFDAPCNASLSTLLLVCCPPRRRLRLPLPPSPFSPIEILNNFVIIDQQQLAGGTPLFSRLLLPNRIGNGGGGLRGDAALLLYAGVRARRRRRRRRGAANC